MPEGSEDIFGKVDAILGKRAGFAGGRAEAQDEFPVLTDVIAETPPSVPRTRVEDAMAADAVAEPPAGEAAESIPSCLGELDIDRLAAALEARLSELFIRQQLRIESLVRQVVREEIEKRAGHRG
jgi:hypothetical protein